MKKVKILSFVFAAVMAVSATSCSAPPADKIGAVSASASADFAAEWLSERLGDSAASVTVGLDEDARSYGVSLDGFRDDGYMIRKQDGDAVVFGKTEDGLDRGVRYYAKHFVNVSDASFVYGDGAKVKKLTIADNDISEYVIMLPEETDECHNYSAAELRKYIGNACGIYPEIISYDADYNGLKIALERVYPDDPRFKELGTEGFTVSVKDGNMTVSGGHYNGCLYGVYELLRDFVGYRFLYDYANYDSFDNKNDGMIDYLYESEHIDIPEGTNDTTVPSFNYRQASFVNWEYFCNDFTVKNGDNHTVETSSKYNAYGILGEANHGIMALNLDYHYFGIHHASYKQPCFTDEGFIEFSRDEYIKDVYNKLDAGQTIGREFTTVDVSQVDAITWCQCQNCMELVSLDGGNCGPVVNYTNIMAEAIDNEFPEEKYGYRLNVAMLAYVGNLSAPKVTKPYDTVTVSWCFYIDDYGTIGHDACYNHKLDGSECDINKKYSDTLRDWCALVDRVTVWYYPGYWNYGSFSTPVLKNIRNDMAFLYSLGVDGVINCTSHMIMPDEHIIPYVLGRLYWDADMPEEEYEALISECAYILYGDGASYILEYMDRLEEYAIDDCYSTIRVVSPSTRINLDSVELGFAYDRELLDRAVDMADSAFQERNATLRQLLVYNMGLISSHTSMYLNGTDESRAEYEAMYNYFTNTALEENFIHTSDSAKKVYFSEYADELDVSENPAKLYKYDTNPYEWWK